MSISSCMLVFVMLYVVMGTPLDDYVNMPDPTYKYTLNGTINGPDYTGYIIRLTSQTWLTAQDSDRSVWQHWLTICVPKKPIESGPYAMMYIDGGDTDASIPDTIDPLSIILCTKANVVSARIGAIPNQPITFTGDWRKKRRSEDAIIAYTWSHFLNDTTHPFWLLRLPMTKAVVRAMDTVQDFLKGIPNVPKIEKFGVAGASKRGWTTWTTGIVDKRVALIAPIVIPVLNMHPTIKRMFQPYGNWSFALEDYLDMGIMHLIDMPEFFEMAAIIDPYSYLDRLHMPKYITCALGDEFFLPDSTRYFFDGLPEPKFLRMIPNAEHSLAPQDIDIAVSIGTWFHMIIKQKPLPRFSWKLIRSNSTNAQIIVNAIDKPDHVYMWSATTLSGTKRDFRLITCPSASCFNPVFWFSKELEDQGNGTYIATMNAPPYGWTGFVVELMYVQSNNPVDPEGTVKFTTEANIVPDTMPYPPCSGKDC